MEIVQFFLAILKYFHIYRIQCGHCKKYSWYFLKQDLCEMRCGRLMEVDYKCDKCGEWIFTITYSSNETGPVIYGDGIYEIVPL